MDLAELLTSADFITVHATATEETHHLFSTEAQIRAAALDVTEQEPIDPEDPHLALDNLIITPHVAAGSPVTFFEGGHRQAENVARVLAGQAPHGLANPEVIKTIAVMRATDPGRWEGTPDFSTALAL